MLDMLIDILDPLMLHQWAELFAKVLTIIPAPMGVLLSIAVVSAIIRAFV